MTASDAELDPPPDGVERPLIAGEHRQDYIYREQKRCRGCRATIYWWETPAGKWSPHDQDGTSHFATCPVAEKFRGGQNL